MENKYLSVLSLRRYTVEEINFKINKKYNNDNVNIDFKISKKVTYTDNLMNVELDTVVFENAENNNYPFEMEVRIEGLFEFQGDVKNTLEANAIAILYPYIRAIVSNYTANANVNSLILPIINVNKYIEECEKKEQN